MTKRHAGGILLAALLLSFAALVPKAFAKEDSIVGGGVNVYTDVESVLRVNIPDDITLKIDPGSKDPYTIPIKLNIYTNSPDGYNSFLSTNKNRADFNDGTATALVHQDDSNYKIDALEASAPFDDFPAGFWGYSIDGGKTFESLPAADDTPVDANTDAGIYFGVKVPEFQASGRYTNTIVVSVVTRYVQSPADLFNGIEYMQDMTQEICETENSGISKQLIDRRDGKVYWVTKMRDNSCWMTQNLDFEIASSGTTLTPADSNVFATRTLYKEDARGGNNIFYQDGGDFYVPNGDTYDDNDNPYPTSELEPDAVDWHYHVGSIYSWPAATAGSGNGDIFSNEADESICPKGWRLPVKVSNVAQDRSYSFFRLFMSQPEAKTSSNNAYSTFTLQAIGTKPFYFIDARKLFTDVNYDVMPFLPESYSVGGYSALRRTNQYLASYWTSTSVPAGLNSNDSQGAYNEGYYDENGNRTVAHTYLLYNGSSDSSYNNGATILGYYYNSLIDLQTTGSFVRCVSSKNDLYSISTMQEVTQEIIDNTDIENAKQLVDTRDGKKYWVTKEYDGNLWMTQNLDFEISTSGTTLTPSDSDVLTTKTITAEANFGTDPDGIYYLDEGNYYYYASDSGRGYYDIYNNGRELREFDGKQSMRGHGRVGDFYSWNAATAGSGATIAYGGDDAPESICPKGWSLPTNGGANDLSEGSYDDMMMSFLAMDDRKMQRNYYEQYYYNRNYAGSAANPPLYFHFTGIIDETGSLNKATSGAFYWSSRFKSEAESGDRYAYQFKVISNDRMSYKPSDDNIEKTFYGAKIRCVAVKTRSFTLNYNANGGIGAPASQYGNTSGDTFTFTLSDYVPIRAGLEFRGWATSPDATDAEYQPGDSATFQYGTTTLYAIWGPKLIITFNANGGYGTMGNQVIESGVSKALYKNTFRHDGIFKFLGWSINRNATVAEYKNGAMYTVPIIAHDTNITLYAIWQEMDAFTMQDFECGDLGEVGESTELVDVRDNSIYTVAKLIDGNCWMTENLKLDLGRLAEDLSAENTNSPTINFINMINYGVSSSDNWCTNYDQSCFDTITYNTSNVGDALYDSYGAYYNWYTATAGNGNYSLGSNSVVTGDICPYGWRLPTGGYDGELYQLYAKLGYDQTRLHAAPNNFMYSGSYYGSSMSSRDSYGYYWSSTADGNSYAYYLYLYDNYADYSDTTRYNGYSVRCIAK